MESKLKQQCQDSVGELPNLLLREGGYPHLPTTPIKQEPKSDAWNDAGTKPNHPCLCLTQTKKSKFYQYWNGDFFGIPSSNKSAAYWGRDVKSEHQEIQWREVQP